jgi:two-component system sensor histidine kinase DesK
VGSERADRLVRLTSVGVVAWTVGLTAKFLLLTTNASVLAEPALFGSLACLPVAVALVLRGVRGVRSWSSYVLVAAVALVLIGVLPVGGPLWPPTFGLLAGFGLIFFELPWSLVMFAACIAVADGEAVVWATHSPLSSQYHWYGEELISYDTVIIIWTGIALAVLVWLARIIRELRGAQRQLAASALTIERQRIDNELSQTIGAALELIIAAGQSAAELAAADPDAAARELRGLTARSRTTLASARHVLTGYRAVSLHAELQAVVTLLAAAGIRATLSRPDAELPAELPEPARARLRAAVAEILTSGAATECRITVTDGFSGDLDVEVTAERAAVGEARI